MNRRGITKLNSGTHEDEAVPQQGSTIGGERMQSTKEVYVRPVLTKHELLRDVTAAYSGGGVLRDRIEDITCRLFPNLPRCR